MKKKFLLGGALALVVAIAIAIFCIVGINNGAKEPGADSGAADNATTTNDIETVLSFYHETYLFHSKKSVKYILSLDKDNRLVGYEYVEKYYDFDETGGDFELICQESPAEAINNTKIFKFLTETAECNRDAMEVTITDVYDISKFDSKNNISKAEIVDNLDDNYILNVENLKTALSNKGYTYEEK